MSSFTIFGTFLIVYVFLHLQYIFYMVEDLLMDVREEQPFNINTIKTSRQIN